MRGLRYREWAMQNLGSEWMDALDDLAAVPIEERVATRREKFRRMGAIEDHFPVLN